MSVTTSTRATCSTCGAVDEDNDVPLGYCSPACYYRAKGEKLLSQLASDPELCATCFAVTRNAPVDLDAFHATCREAFNGRTAGPVCPTCAARYDRYAHHYREPSAVRAVRAEATAQPHRPIYREGWGCACGATDTREPDPALRETVPTPTTANRLWRALRRLAAKGAIDGTPDLDAFRAAYDERPTDAAYLAGRALYGSDRA